MAGNALTRTSSHKPPLRTFSQSVSNNVSDTLTGLITESKLRRTTDIKLLLTGVSSTNDNFTPTGKPHGAAPAQPGIVITAREMRCWHAVISVLY